MTGFDDAGMNRPDRDFENTFSFHAFKNVLAGNPRNLLLRLKIFFKREMASGPVLVKHKRSGIREVSRDQAKKILNLTFLPIGLRQKRSDGRKHRIVFRDPGFKDDKRILLRMGKNIRKRKGLVFLPCVRGKEKNKAHGKKSREKADCFQNRVSRDKHMTLLFGPAFQFADRIPEFFFQSFADHFHETTPPATRLAS